mmetsp:Transcript_28769/g.54585  ORF Transcript_28769/g.54585 Transcript_28769/m.54585 type:complete len:277 (+) Transcript_28769:347-1177(+)
MCHASLSLTLGLFDGLCDPAFTLDPTFERQFLVHISNVLWGPCCDLRKGGHTVFVQFFLKRRANTGQLFEVIRSVGGLGGGLLGFGLGGLFGGRSFRSGLCLGRFGFLGGRLGRLGGCGGKGKARTVFGGHDTRRGCARGQNVGHAHQRQLLAVAFGPLGRVFPAALDEVDGLGALELFDHFGLYARISHHGGANDRGVATDHQNFVELDSVTCICGQFFNAEHVARLNFVLFAAGFENREHMSFLYLPRPVAPGHPAFWVLRSGPASNCAPHLGT